MHQRYTRRQLLLGGTVAALGSAGCLGVSTDSGPSSNEWNLDGRLSISQAQQYNSPGCSCCEQYGSYLQENMTGSLTEIVPEDITAVKRNHGVPAELDSCHTVVLDEYVVEGHVPAKAIETLLVESPSIDGIALAGMPTGAPGMPGEKETQFAVRAFADGRVADTFAEF